MLSIYGAVADLCNELPKDLGAPGKPTAPDHLEKWKFLLTSLLQRNPPMHSIVGPTLVPMNSGGVTCCKSTSESWRKLSDDQNLSKLCSNAGLKNCRTRKILQVSRYRRRREFTMPRNEKWTRRRGWILKSTRIGPVLNIKVCYHDDRFSVAG